MGQIRLKLIDSPSKIKADISRAMADHVNQMVIRVGIFFFPFFPNSICPGCIICKAVYVKLFGD